MFSKGDVVERTEGNFRGMFKGDRDTVVEADKHDNVALEKFGEGHAEYNLKKVGEEPLKAGDRVRIKVRNVSPLCSSRYKKGNTAVYKGGGTFEMDKDGEHQSCSDPKSQERIFERIGEVMSKYEEMKGRIGALDEGWTKEADDILSELFKVNNVRLWVESYSVSYGRVVIATHGATLDNIAKGNGIGGTEYKADFSFSDQCGKLAAFKNALLWLLDNSSLKEEGIVGTEQKVEIEGKVYQAKILSKE